MKGLRCTTCNCEFNRSCHCNAGVIKVSKNGVCETKQKRRYGIIQQNSVNIEAAKDFDYDDGKELLVQCDCGECIFNKNRICTSSIVNMGDGLMKTKYFSKAKSGN